MRILFLADFYPPVLGGLELEVQALAHGLAERGHEVSVAALTLDAPSVNSEGGVTVHRIRGWNRLNGCRRAARATVSPDGSRPRGDGGAAAHHRDGATAGRLGSLVDRLLVPAVEAVERDPPGDEAARLRAGLPEEDVRLSRRPVLRTGVRQVPGVRRRAVRSGWRAGLDGGHHDAGAPAKEGGRPVHREQRCRRRRQLPGDRAATVRPGRRRAVAVGRCLYSADHPRPDFVPAGDFLLYVGALGLHKGLGVLLEPMRGSPRRCRRPCGHAGKDTPTSLPDGVKIVHNVPHKEVLAAWPTARSRWCRR